MRIDTCCTIINKSERAIFLQLVYTSRLAANPSYSLIWIRWWYKWLIKCKRQSRKLVSEGKRHTYLKQYFAWRGRLSIEEKHVWIHQWMIAFLEKSVKGKDCETANKYFILSVCSFREAVSLNRIPINKKSSFVSIGILWYVFYSFPISSLFTR